MLLYEIFSESEIIDFEKAKSKKKQDEFNTAINNFMDAINSIHQREKEFFETYGKFHNYVQKYIESNYNPDWRPKFDLDVSFKDYLLNDEQKDKKKRLKAQGFEFQDVKYHKDFVGDKKGSFGSKDITEKEAISLFTNRNSPSVITRYGTYQPSRAGYRLSRKEIWSDDGMGFSIVFHNYKDAHIIDDEKDLNEAIKVMDLIRRHENLKVVK